MGGEASGRGGGGVGTGVTAQKQMRKSDEEIKRENDIKRFEQLLNSESATINYGIDGSTDNYLTKKQEENEINAGCELFFSFCERL